MKFKMSAAAAFLCLIFTINFPAQINLKSIFKGKIVRSNLRGIRYAQITILNLLTLESQTRRTNDFGNFQFNELPFGDFYLITIKTSKSGNFSPYASIQLSAPVNELTIYSDQ